MTASRKTPALTGAAPFAIRSERACDVAAREALLDACFGLNRHARTCQRLREARAPAQGLAFSAVRRGRLLGTIRLWHVSAGGTRAVSQPVVGGHHTHEPRGRLETQAAHDLVIGGVAAGAGCVGDLDHRRADRWPGLTLEHHHDVLVLGRRPALDAFKRKVRGLQPSLGWYDLSAVWIAD